jgi:predicted transcriptional regulator
MTFGREFPQRSELVDTGHGDRRIDYNSGMKVKTAKDTIRDVLDECPDDATMDEILYRLDFKAAVLRGMAQVRRGETVSQEEAEQRMTHWPESAGH